MKRFYQEAGVAEDGDGFIVALDGRPVMAPAGVRLQLSTRALAEAIAAEWEAQEDEVGE